MAFRQVRRQNSVTGGEDRKNIGGGHRLIFSSNSEVKTKKVFNPNYTAWIWAVCPLSRHNSRSGVTFIARRGAMETYGVDVGSCPQIQWRRQKKRSSARNLRLRLAFTRVFRPGKRLYSRLSSIYFTLHSIYFTRLYSRLSSILGAEASKCTTVAPGLFRFFGHSARFEGAFFAWGAQAVIWGGARSQNPWRGPVFRLHSIRASSREAENTNFNSFWFDVIGNRNNAWPVHFW